MKCPTCGYNSFDHLDTCKKCGSELKGDQSMRPLIRGEEDEHDYEPLGKSMPEDRSEKGSIADELLNIPINDRPAPSGLDADEGPPNFHRKEHREQMDLFHESEEAEEASNKSAGGKPDLLEEEGSPEDWLPEHTGGADKYRDPFTEQEERYTEPEKQYNEPGTDVYNLAGFFPRAAAFAVDIGIIFVVAYVTLKIGLFVAGAGSQNAGYLFPALFVLASTYFIFLHALSGKTIGKMLMKIRVINSEGEDVGVWDAFLRWIGYFISAIVMLAGFFWAAFDSEGQAWHDKIAGTYVVKD
jgi:uncharacterized RDD family membrane protein YckC